MADNKNFEMKDEELDQVAGGFGYDMKECVIAQDSYGNEVLEIWKIFNRQTQKMETYTGKNRDDVLKQINDDNKRAGYSTFEFYDDETKQLEVRFKVK